MKTIATSLLLTATTIISGSGQNLISNSSFEASGQLNCQFWYDACGRELTFLCDTIAPDTVCGAEFYQNAPQGGGNWSLFVGTGMVPPPKSGITYISGLSGTNIFNLTVWMKTGEYSGGSIGFGTFSQGQFIEISYMSDCCDTGWHQYSLTDTFFTLPTDTIAVQLAPTIVYFDGAIAYFDLVQLTILDSMITIGNENIYKNKNEINLYQNSSKENITLEINGGKNENYFFTIYNSIGQMVLNQSISKKIVIDTSKFQKGLYFVEVCKAKGVVCYTEKVIVE